MRLRDVSIEPTRVHLAGPRAVLEIRCPAPGVLRLRHAPSSAVVSPIHPELRAKRSWAVVSDQGLSVEARRDGDTVHVTADGVALELSSTDGGWAFSDDRGRLLARCVEVAAEVERAYPVDRHRTRIALHAPPDEAYLGFGEKVGPIDKRGMRFLFWNTDAFPPHPDTDPLYASIPFFLGLREGVAWGLLLDEAWRSEVDVALTDGERVEWRSSGPELDVYLIAGPRPADVVRRYASLTGLSAMPPLWSLGAQQSRWGYENADDVRGVARGYRMRGLPLDAIYLDIDYMDAYKVFTWDQSRFEAPAALTRELGAEGIRIITIIDPGVKVEPGYAVYEEARAGDHLVRRDRGDLLVGEVWPDPAVFPDFTRASVRRWWGDWHAPLIAAGVAGIWNDMNEPACFEIQPSKGPPVPPKGERASVGTLEGSTLPYEARHGALRHLEVHNVYGLGMAQAAFEGLLRHAPGRRPFVLTRAAFAGIQRWAAVWTGDFASHFTHLEASIPMLLGLGLSGVPFVGADVPGFVGRASGELLARWMEVGTFYPLFRNHSAKGQGGHEPWQFGEPFLSIARAALERRYRLLPALYTLMREAAETGLPPLRALVFVAPESREALAAFDQFLFGEDLLAAPVVRPGQSKRLAWLPRGRWLEFANLERAGAVVEGDRHVIAEAPLDVVPLWLREGGALPLTEAALHTTTANWARLNWHVHAGARVEGRLYEDEGDGHGASRVTTISGGLSGASFRLERRAEGALPLAREVETIVVYGLGAPRAVRGARVHRRIGDALEIEVAADWVSVEIQLAAEVAT